jgi:hypothetical protein
MRRFGSPSTSFYKKKESAISRGMKRTNLGMVEIHHNNIENRTVRCNDALSDWRNHEEEKMFGFTIKGLVAALISVVLLFIIGCKDDPKSVCCKCTCYNSNFSTTTKDFYVDGDNLNCAKSCLTLCTEEQKYESVQAQSEVSCDAIPVDTE